MDISDIIDNHIKQFKQFNCVSVATSGGADSMALCLLLHKWAKMRGVELIALHVNHGLRSQADCEALQVQDWLSACGIKCLILKANVDIAAMAGNMMQNARNVRYELMQQYCLQNKISALFVAHHSGDQAETFLMRLARASGVDGLSSMRAVNDLAGVKIIRPLLGFSKLQLQNYLREIGQQWLEDPTNQNVAYTRTKMRNLLEVMHENGVSINRIAQSATHLARTSDFLAEHTAEWIAKNAIIEPQKISIQCGEWLALHEEMQLRTLSFILQHFHAQKRELRYEKLENLRISMLNPSAFNGRTLNCCKINVRKNNYIITPQNNSILE